MGAGSVKYSDTGRNGFRNASVGAGNEYLIELLYPLRSPGDKTHEDYLGLQSQITWDFRATVSVKETFVMPCLP